jgi:hypothetical protein
MKTTYQWIICVIAAAFLFVPESGCVAADPISVGQYQAESWAYYAKAQEELAYYTSIDRPVDAQIWYNYYTALSLYYFHYENLSKSLYYYNYFVGLGDFYYYYGMNVNEVPLRYYYLFKGFAHAYWSWYYYTADTQTAQFYYNYFMQAAVNPSYYPRA